MRYWLGIGSHSTKKNRKKLLNQAKGFQFSNDDLKKLKQRCRHQSREKKKLFKVWGQNTLVVKLFLNCASQWDLHPVSGMPHRLNYQSVSLRLQTMQKAQPLSSQDTEQLWDDLFFMERIALNQWTK